MNKRRQKTGLPPGSIIFTGNRKVDKIGVYYVAYNESAHTEQVLDNQTITAFHEPDKDLVQWYDIRGLHDVELIKEIGKVFQVHVLNLEDIVDTLHRPKFEELDQALFFVISALSYNKASQTVQTEQITIYVGDGYVLTFQENETDIFLKIRERLRNQKGRIRRQSADYLAYCLLDVIVDNYFLVLEEIQLDIEELEAAILQTPDSIHKNTLHQLRQQLINTRKFIAPLREAINQFVKSDHPLLTDTTQLYGRDLYSHTIQLMDSVDTYRELLNSLQDLYLSEISFKMNQVMQVLTIITTIFVPLSFLVGLYGMNFEYIPELQYRYGYFVLLGLMLLISIGLIGYFKKQNWF